MEIPHQGPLTAESHNCPLYHTTTAFYFQLDVSREARKYFNVRRRGGEEEGREDEWFQCDLEEFPHD